MTRTIAGTVLTGGRPVAARVAIDGDGTIAATPSAGARHVSLPAGWIVAPGFVDLQVNGFGGHEVGEDPAANAAVARSLVRAGVVAFCPTLVTRDMEGYRRAAAGLALTDWPADGARALAPHLEGPFLNPARAGAHRADDMHPPSPAALDALLGLFAPAVVTLAPELEDGLAAVARIVRSGAVAAVGHSQADAHTGRLAIAAGARLLTHAMNAMPGIGARTPPASVAVLGDEDAYVSLIGDGVHVAPEVAALIVRLAGARAVLVSDASAPAGGAPGRYGLGPRVVTYDGRRVLTDDGRLAGAGAGLDVGVRTLVGAGIDTAAALAAACEAPRRLLGLPDGLTPGVPADLVVLDEALIPRFTLIGGRVVHADPETEAPAGLTEVG